MPAVADAEARLPQSLAQHLVRHAEGKPSMNVGDRQELCRGQWRLEGHPLPSGNSVGSGALMAGVALGSIHRAGTGMSAGLPRDHLK